MNAKFKFIFLVIIMLVIVLISLWAFLQIGINEGWQHWKFYATFTGAIGSSGLLFALILRRKRVLQ